MELLYLRKGKDLTRSNGFDDCFNSVGSRFCLDESLVKFDEFFTYLI